MRQFNEILQFHNCNNEILQFHNCNKKITFWTLLLLSYIFICSSCESVSRVTKTTSNEKIEIVYKDSVRYYDSTVVVPVERYVDIVRDYDTLELETSQAKAKAWVDSIYLRGEIENKKITQYKYVDRWHVRDSSYFKDKEDSEILQIETIRYVKNPVDKKLLIWCIISSLGLLGTLWLTFREKIIKSIK